MPAFTQCRETVINAPIASVHAAIDDFRTWIAWSPWEGLDPDLERTYSGPDRGTGASYAWVGNKKAGSGTMTITSSTLERIEIDLEFIAPFKASNKCTFELLAAGPNSSGTRVVWTMSGQRNIVFAVLGALVFDRAIGKDFDRGLEQLKAHVATGE